MFVCEGCGNKVERIKREKSLGRKPKPPFCRSCYERERGLLRQQRRTPRYTDCVVCGNLLPRLKQAGTRHCSPECSTIGAANVVAGYRLQNEIPLDRDGWKCRVCGIDTPKHLRGKKVHNAPQIDHVIPTSQGGSNELSNLQCLCAFCNMSKGGRTMRQWVAAAGHSNDNIERYLEEYGHANAA